MKGKTDYIVKMRRLVDLTEESPEGQPLKQSFYDPYNAGEFI